MADVSTWINVVDNAVKIGLGALLGGGFGLLIARTNNKSQAKKDFHDRRRAILEGVLESVDSSANAASVYWASLINADLKRKKNKPISDKENEELNTFKNNFFDAFTVLNSSGAKLLLLGEQESESKLAILRGEFDDFFKVVNAANKNYTKEDLIAHRDRMSQARKEFYLELSKAYQHDA